jgi:hypothetical protein
MASDRQLEEPLILPGEIQQDVSRVDEKHQEKRKKPSATTPTARNIGIKLNPQMPAPSRARRVQAQLNRSNWNLGSRILWTNRMRNALGVLIKKARGTVS